MNDKPEITTELLEKLMSWLDSTESFVVEQSPLIAQEMLAWVAARSWLLFALGIVLTLLAMAVWALIWRGWDNWTNDDSPEKAIPCCGIAILSSAAAPVLICASIFTLIQIHVAPRVYLLEQLQSLLN